ncbi:MAG: hypothetical protein ACR2G7_06125 [Acidimicrobiales bacterium]
MGAQRTSFAKLQRDRAKKAKAAAKREGRQDRLSESDDELPTTPTTEPLSSDDSHELSAPELLELIERIHQQFDAKLISYDDFEEKKSELLARLPID